METGRSDGTGLPCRSEARTPPLDFTRKRAELFIPAANPPAAVGQPEAKSGSGSPHYFRDSFSWRKENARNLTVELEPYTGDVVHFEVEHAVTHPPASVTKEAAIVTAVDALRKKYPKHF